MAKQQKSWVYSPAKEKANVSLPPAFKDEIKQRDAALIQIQRPLFGLRADW